MEWVEQNISGVKLEKLRRDAEKKTKIMRWILPCSFAVFMAIALVKKAWVIGYLDELQWGDSTTTGLLFVLLGDLMMSAILSCVIYLFYSILVWRKAYDRFNYSFKNKYVLDTIRQIPGFSNLKYNSQSGMTYEEMDRMNLIPKGDKVYFTSSDELTGELDGVRFRTSNVSTGQRPKGRRSLPDILFEGQVLTFSNFDDRKISQGFVQVFSRKALPEIKRTTAPLNIHTENSVFNENFVVFAENEANAFYILTPQVLEQITAFQEAMEGKVYLAFIEKKLYVTCSQLRNPFDARLDLTVEEQCRQIVQDTKILRSVRDILVRASEKNHSRNEFKEG